jgi:hypothetical protein
LLILFGKNACPERCFGFSVIKLAIDFLNGQVLVVEHIILNVPDEFIGTHRLNNGNSGCFCSHFSASAR